MNSSLPRRAAAATFCGAAAATLLTVGAPGAAAEPGRGASELAAVRAATAKYHDVDRALADGYIPVSHCEELPGVGAMGIHYLKPALAEDAELTPTRPEVLLYEPRKNGKLRLVGVEYFIAEAAVTRHPSLLGHEFDGPMAGHAPGMPDHYDLHVWLWKRNPAGLTQAWNPAVSCEHDTTGSAS